MKKKLDFKILDVNTFELEMLLLHI